MAQTLQELVPQYPLAAPLAVGLLSALGFAVANSMQHLVAGTVPPHVNRAGAVLRHLATRPRWLVATCCSFLAMVLHAWALHLGSITLVQPLMLVGVVLAVPLRAGLERKAPEWAAVKAVGVTVVGLAAFLSFADLQPGRSAPRVTMALPVVVWVLWSPSCCPGAPHARQRHLLGRRCWVCRPGSCSDSPQGF